MSLTLGIESSCDETAVAVVEDFTHVRANCIHTQTIHADYGGVVPELASREHVSRLRPLLQEALSSAGCALRSIDGIAVTRGPGLIGCLLSGVSFAKALALRIQRPFIGVNHLEAHAVSPRLVDPDFPLPHVSLIASGGHTSLVLTQDWDRFQTLGQTRDDAAGEALDKVGKLVGLPYPAGATIDRIAQAGNPHAIRFPRAMLEEGSLDFSFSGLKTAAAIYLEDHPEVIPENALPDFLASFQAAVVDVLVAKLMVAAQTTQADGVALTGGVACNSLLRRRVAHEAERARLSFVAPPPDLCTDNAAMISARGAIDLAAGKQSPRSLTAVASWPLRSAISE